MSIVQFILTTTAAIGLTNAASSRLVDVMSVATDFYETQLHSNVTAYDVCMFLATGYQVIQRDTDKNISTEAYDDLDQGVARILSRYVNDEYDNTIEALDTYNTTQRVENFDVSECDGITEDEVIDWYFPSTELPTDYEQDLDRGRREASKSYCLHPGQNCLTREGRLDATLCSTSGASSGVSCGCAEYGPFAAACQTSYHQGKDWATGHHQGWGTLTGLSLWFIGRCRSCKRMVRFKDNGHDY